MKNFAVVYLRAHLAIAFITVMCPPALLSQGEIPITTSSKEALALFIAGRDKQENVDLPAAARLLDQALEKDPDFALANLYRAFSGGGASVTRPRLEKAVSLADKVSPGERLQILAAKASADGDRITYKKHIDELLKLHPGDKRGRYIMAGYYLSMGDVPNYVAWLNKVIETDKNFTPAYDRLGYAYKNMSKFEEAEEAFLKEIELAPNIANSYDSYAELLLKWGKFDESIKYYQKAMRTDPEFKTPLRGIGLNQMHKGDFVKAREFFEQYYNSAQQVGGKLDALASSLYSYLHEWNIDAAMKVVDRHRQLAEKENIATSVVTNHIWRTVIAMETGKMEDAEGGLRDAKTSNQSPNIPTGTKNTNEVNLGLLEANLLSAKKDFSGARKQLETMRTVIEKRGISFEQMNWQTSAGYLELMQGNYDKALEMLQKGNLQDPMNIFRTARAFELKGEAEQAKKSYQAVVNWNWTGINYAITRPQAMKKTR